MDRWGEVLQLPNINRYEGSTDRARAQWLARQGEMGGAQTQAMADLAAALKAQRDAKMAELVAANAGRGGGGGRGRGGGGATADPGYGYVDTGYQEQGSWLDQYLDLIGESAPPPSMSRPNSVNTADPRYRVPRPSAPKGKKGYVPPPKPTKPKLGQKGYVPPRPTKYATRLS